MAEKNKVGRPTKYEPSMLKKIESMGKQGLSKTQIAARLDISRDTLYDWCKTNKEFSDAIKKAHLDAQDIWEQRLYDAAMGSTQDDLSPNPTLMIFVMKNRFAEQWREKQTTEHEVSGAKSVKIEWGE
jgi:hypothetical protein